MLEAVGLAVACLTVCESVALALDAAALLALVPLRVRLAFKPTLAWRNVALIRAMLVLAQPVPATDRALRGPMVLTAVAKDAAVRVVTTHLRLANVRLIHALSHTLRTFGSELHGQWRAEEGIAPTPSLPSPSPALSSSGGLALGRNSPAATFLAHSAGYL
jgi:hypothetical protein